MTHAADPHREALHDLGLTDEQIDRALSLTIEEASTSAYDPQRVEQLEHENGITPLSPRCEQTAAELFMSLNGFDEIAIAQRFGAPIGELRADAVTLGRALIFVHVRRAVSMRDDEAYRFAMEQTIQTVSHDYFTPEPKDDDDASAEGNAPSA